LRGVGAAIVLDVAHAVVLPTAFRLAKRTRQPRIFLSAIQRQRDFFDRETTDRDVRGLQDFVWIPRWENSIDLSPNQVVAGGSFRRVRFELTGANSRTQIYGCDLFYKWKSAMPKGGSRS